MLVCYVPDFFWPANLKFRVSTLAGIIVKLRDMSSEPICLPLLTVPGFDGCSDTTCLLTPRPTEFVVPGGNSLSAALDTARAVVRRAERRSVEWAADVEGSHVVQYLNRLADLLFMMARQAEEAWTPTRPE